MPQVWWYGTNMAFVHVMSVYIKELRKLLACKPQGSETSLICKDLTAELRAAGIAVPPRRSSAGLKTHTTQFARETRLPMVQNTGLDYWFTVS